MSRPFFIIAILAVVLGCATGADVDSGRIRPARADRPQVAPGPASDQTRVYLIRKGSFYGGGPGIWVSLGVMHDRSELLIPDQETAVVSIMRPGASLGEYAFDIWSAEGTSGASRARSIFRCDFLPVLTPSSRSRSAMQS